MICETESLINVMSTRQDPSLIIQKLNSGCRLADCGVF